MMLIPCIQPVTIAERVIEIAGFLSGNNESMSDASAERQNSPVDAVRGLGIFLYIICAIRMEIIAKIGSATPVRIEISLLSEKLSFMKEGIQVVTPSLSIPCAQIASIIVPRRR